MINTLSPDIYQAMQLNASIYKQLAQLFMYKKKLKQIKRYVNEKWISQVVFVLESFKKHRVG